MTRTELTAFIEGVKAIRTSATDEQALDAIGIYPIWSEDKEYTLDIRVQYDGKLYKCVQAHKSQTGWEPDKTPALWTEVAKPGEIPVWKQPTGAQDAYMTGDKVHYPNADGPVYICTIDYNVYAPDISGWETC